MIFDSLVKILKFYIVILFWKSKYDISFKKKIFIFKFVIIFIKDHFDKNYCIMNLKN